MKKTKIELADNDLEQIIKDKLYKDPYYYLNFLRRIIDDFPVTMKYPVDGFLSEKSPLKVEGIDFLFYPWTRKQLKEWQRDKSRGDEKACENLDKVFSLLFKGKQGVKKGEGTEKRKKLSLCDEEQVHYDFIPVDRVCKKICRNKYKASRTLALKEFFPNEAASILKNDSVAIERITPETLRTHVLAERYKCSVRAITEFLRDYFSERRDILSEFKK